MNDTDDTMATDLEPLMLELGKAVYICQAFESTLCLLHAMMSHEDASGLDGAFTASWDFHSAKTLGQTINALRKRIDIPAKLSDYLEEGIKCRNQIVHGFMKKNIARLMEFKGRLEVQKELEALKLEVKRRDITMNKLLDVFFAKYGLSNKELKRQAGELYAAKNNPSTTGKH
jgi:hypothetical protein